MILKQESAFNKRSAVLSEGVGRYTGSDPLRRADGLGARATPRSGSSGIAEHLTGPGVEVSLLQPCLPSISFGDLRRRFLTVLGLQKDT